MFILQETFYLEIIQTSIFHNEAYFILQHNAGITNYVES